MADYYPLIARAIAGLDPSAPGESRRALYERARAALIAQLRGVDPPLSESEITRERLALEEAVRKVESEAAQRARDTTARGGGGNGDRARAGDAFRATTRPGAKPGEAPPRSRAPARQEERPERSLRADAAVPRRGADNNTAPAMRGFRDIAADADDLGRAAAQASRSARKTYANVPSPSPEFDRVEPGMENRGADPALPYSYDESAAEAARWTPPPDQPAARPRAPDKSAKKKASRAPRVGGGGFPFKSAIAIGIVLIFAGAAILWGPAAVSYGRNMVKPTAVVEAPKDAGSAPRTKIPDRVGQPSSETV